MRILRWLVVFALCAIGAVIALTIVARFADGPIGPFAGGGFRSGELVSGPEPDWSFAATIPEVELQLVEPPRSRTLWIVVHEGQIYVPCGFLNVPFWKQWPYEAIADGRAILRIDGKLHERQAVKVTDPALYQQLFALVKEKYGLGRDRVPDPDLAWVFRLEPRSE